MIKGIILLADGFEETEAITTHDVLKRSHEIDPIMVSISSSLEVSTSAGLTIKAHKILKDISLNEYDFVVLPGGLPGVTNLRNSDEVINLIHQAYKLNKHVYAICAAPSILGELGYLDNHKYTCFPGFERGNGEYIDEGVVNDNGLITARSMGYTIPFASEIVKELVGEECLKNIENGTLGLSKKK